jgi:hypothetical protein
MPRPRAPYPAVAIDPLRTYRIAAIAVHSYLAAPSPTTRPQTAPNRRGCALYAKHSTPHCLSAAERTPKHRLVIFCRPQTFACSCRVKFHLHG